jgi:membrane protein
MMGVWRISRSAVSGFIAHDALSRGAAIAFYSVTSLAPVLLIVIGIAGLVFGQDDVRHSVIRQLSGLMGSESADLFQSIITRSTDPQSGAIATVTGLIMVLVTASGVFGEMHTALNITWNVEASKQSFLSLVRTRAASLGLVAALGFMLIVSLATSAALSAFGDYLGSTFAFANIILSVLNTVISLVIFTILFSAIYKVLPDAPIAWRDVLTGGLITAALFTLGKSLIGWYLGRAVPSSGYGAAGSLLVLLLWTYYSAQIFLFGAELTKATADYRSPSRDAGDSRGDREKHRAA